MSLDQTAITITKLEAARRQLNTAIWLWFVDGDPVSIHSLAYAAYEIIHVVSRHRKRTQKLLFDATFMRGEYQAKVAKFLKKHANFFKHANKDVEGNIDFPPAISVLFLMSSIMGIISMRLPRSDAETDFMVWHAVHDRCRGKFANNINRP
jgi:hypothetical protein